MAKNHNSTVNQEIKRKFIQREINCCATFEIAKLLSLSYQVGDSDLPQYDDISNFFRYPDFSGKFISDYTGNEADRKKSLEILEDEISKLDAIIFDYKEFYENNLLTDYRNKIIFNRIDNLENLSIEMEREKQEFEEQENEPAEILEWWNVSREFFEKLKEKNEPVLDYGSGYYWGRTCSGQAIFLDSVISEICNDVEILEGMKILGNN